MGITEIADMILRSSQMQKRGEGPRRSGGSLPEEGHQNPFEDPDLNITGKSPSDWQKRIPVDEGVADELRSLIRDDFVKRNGMCGTGAQADAQANIIKRYIAGLPGDQKLSAIYSCEQIAFEECDRLSAKIRESNPNWQYGQSFDVGILKDVPARGLNVQV